MGRSHSRGQVETRLAPASLAISSYFATKATVGTVPDPIRVTVSNGIELHYIARGQGAALVFLHGGMGDLDSWSPQLELFSQSFHVITYSRRYSFPNRNPLRSFHHCAFTEARDLVELLRTLRIESAHLVGTSYGAFVALALAIGHPQLARSLVLVEPPVHRWACASATGEVLYGDFIGDVWMPAARAFAAGLVMDAMRVLFEGMGGLGPFTALQPSHAARIIRNACSMEALVRSSDPFPDLPRAVVRMLEVPALLLRGEHTIELHKHVNDELASALPLADQFVISGAGHNSPRENPAEFNAVVSGFLALQHDR